MQSHFHKDRIRVRSLTDSTTAATPTYPKISLNALKIKDMQCNISSKHRITEYQRYHEIVLHSSKIIKTYQSSIWQGCSYKQ